MKKLMLIKLNYILLLGLLIIFTACPDPNPPDNTLTFSKKIDVSGSPTKILRLSNGDYIVSGIDNYETNQGFLLCVDENFEFVWKESVDIVVNDMLITGNDEIILAGCSYGNSSNNYKFKPKVTKHQSDGTLIWSKMLGLEDTGLGKINKMIITSDGGLLFGGYKNAAGQSWYTVGFVAKTDMELNLETPNSWSKIIDGEYFIGEYDETLSLLEIDQDGTPEYIISGITHLGTFIANGNDMWLMRFSQNGNKQKSTIFRVPNDVVGKINDLAEFGDEIVGMGSWAFTESNDLSAKCWLINFDKTTLNINWNYKKGIDGSFSFAYDMIKTENGSYLILGIGEKSGGWLTKWDNNIGADDNLLWEKYLGPQYSTATILFLKSGLYIPENDRFVMVGVEEHYDDDYNITSNLLFIKTDGEVNCDGCF